MHHPAAQTVIGTDLRGNGLTPLPCAQDAGKKLEILQSSKMSEIDWLIHGFSTRTGGESTAYSQASTTGELNLGFTAADDPANVAANRQRFLKALTGDASFPLVALRQVHSSIVVRIEAPPATWDSGFADADGMVTNYPGILLAIQTADCIPVLVADRNCRAVAGFHAGWRGTVRRIVERGVLKMRADFGGNPEDLFAVIGPGIGPCCYEVGSELQDEFESEFSYAAALFRKVVSPEETKPIHSHSHQGGLRPRQRPSLHLDLVEANRRQLLDAGLDANAITVLQQCTSCNTHRFFSYRAERGTTGRLLSVIGIRSC